VLFGNLNEARQQATAAVALSPESRDDAALAALILSRSGDKTQSAAITQDLAKRFPLHTVVQAYWLPLLAAQEAMANKDFAGAIEKLRAVVPPLELTVPSNNYDSCLYPIYLRGEADLATNQGTAAAAEFQRILDHKGIVWNCTAGALAHLELGRAYVMAGDKAKGKTAYQDFLTLWKDADSDIPVLREAKTEFANLQ
jgi:eukaryotic-like serine/threonine-protein kinase